MLAAAGVVEAVAGEGRTPVLQHADQPSFFDVGHELFLGQKGDTDRNLRPGNGRFWDKSSTGKQGGRQPAGWYTVR